MVNSFISHLDTFAIFKSMSFIKFSKYVKDRNLTNRKFLRLSTYMVFTSPQIA